MIDIRCDDGGFSTTTEVYRLNFSRSGATAVIESPDGQHILDLDFAPRLDDAALADFAVETIEPTGDGVTVRFTAGQVRGEIAMTFTEHAVIHACTLEHTERFSRFSIGPARGEFFQIHNFDPDLDRLDVPRRITSRLQISSRRTMSAEFLHFDHGNYMAPAYLMGFFDQRRYFAFGLLDVPDVAMPIDGRVTVEQLDMWLDYAARPREGRYVSPRFVICLADSRMGLLDAYRGALGGAEQPLTQPQDWWLYPIYTTWGDQVYAKHLAEGRFSSEAGAEKYLTAELVDAALTKLVSHGIHPGTVVLDEGWSPALGDWQGDDAKFAGSLADYIRAKQADGLRIVLNFNPMLVSRESRLAAEQPRWLVRGAEGAVTTVTRSSRDYHLLDWSCLDARRHIIGQLAAMVAPDGLNADGVKLSGLKFMPDPTDQLADESYGLGERYLLAVMRDIHAAVKSADPAAPIYAACLNPLLESTFDIVRVGNTSEVNHEEHVKRAAMASWLMPDKPIDTDDWASYQKVLGATTFIKTVTGIPNLFSAFYRGDARPVYGGGMGGSPMRMDDRQYRIVAAAWRVYGFGRTIRRGRLGVDFDRMQFATESAGRGAPRVRTAQGGNTLIAYDGSDMYVASMHEARIVLDLPTDFTPSAIERHDEDGQCEQVDFTRCLDDHILFQVLPAAAGTLYYRIKGTS